MHFLDARGALAPARQAWLHGGVIPEISVLLPYRQCQDTIEEAVLSILEQRGLGDHHGLELIAIDDGSTDAGPAHVARLAARHGAVVCLATGGVGIVGALAAGLEQARGRLIARMDGDDLCAPERLALQRELLASDPTLGVVGTQVAGFPEHALGQGMAHYIAWQNQIVSAADHRRAIFVEAPLCHPSVVIRREVLERVGPWRDTGGPEDYDLWLRIDAAGWGLAKVPKVLVQWRHHPGRSTFCDGRYSLDRFRQAKAPFLAGWLHRAGRPVTIWGAGVTGKRLARALEPRGIRVVRFVDIDPRKIGRMARGAPIVAPEALRKGHETVVVAVGARGARDEIRTRLGEHGMIELEDFVCAA